MSWLTISFVANASEVNAKSVTVLEYDSSSTVDLSINASIKSSKIYFGQNTTVIVTIRNEGDIEVEQPILNIQFDGIANSNLTLNSIKPGDCEYRVFMIVTAYPVSPIQPGTYTIRFEVYPADGEVDIEDNVCILDLEVMPDTQEPFIGIPLQTPPPENVQPFQDVKVSVNVTDFESGVKNVTLQYRVNEEEWIRKPMQLNKTTGLYETFIDGYDAGTKITYSIIAFDNAGNSAQQNNAGNYFIYVIIPEYQATYLCYLFLALLSVIVTIKNVKRKSGPAGI